ncbi:MAG TPA: hypothetical protein PLB21_12960 [Actinomycetota bacterium]|nr:hypothetical protein [Actinomycetota bacterium]
MTMNAVGLGRVDGGRSERPRRSDDVLSVSHDAQVVWVDAVPVAADMVEDQALRNRPDQERPHHSVGYVRTLDGVVPGLAVAISTL